MSVGLSWSGNAELVARLTGMFRSLSEQEQALFLEQNGLTRRVPTPSTTNELVLSPQRTLAPNSLVARAVRQRAAQALRLAEGDNASTERALARPLFNVSGVRVADDELRAWFAMMDVEGRGRILKTDFLAMYLEMETFGAPVREKWMRERLATLKTAESDSLTYEEFALLAVHFAQR